MKLSTSIWLTLALSLGLRAQAPDFTPPTPLFSAIMRNDTAEVKYLLAEGANPNEARFLGMPPAFLAVINGNAEALRALVAKGADVKEVDAVGNTLLMWAAASETPSTEIVDELLRLGADPAAKNKMGESAMTWAMRRGSTPIVSSLTRGGGNPDARLKESVETALSLLQKSGKEFVKVSGCASCHHQALPQMATGIARSRGLAVDESLAKYSVTSVIATSKPFREIMLQGTDKIPDPTISVSYLLLGLHAEGYAADENTAAMAHLVSTKQMADGHFPSFPARPPMESSDVTATALSLRALQLYGKEPAAAVARARQWLLKVKPVTNEERTMQLLGLTWADAKPEELVKAGRALLATQRLDGGWAQLPALESDAYATGQAMVALQWAGVIETSDPGYRKGMKFLLRTQRPDGSWLVRSRAFPFQPYKESGFPHGKDQWISAAGTSWAAMALGLAYEPPVPVTDSAQ